LTQNPGLKIASILIAIALWFFVTSRGQSEISIDVPIEFKNISVGLEIVKHSVKSVSLNIKGQERFIKNVKASDIRVPIDLSKAKNGESLFYIAREDINVPHAITITNINPLSVKVKIDETVAKTVKVIPIIIGDPAKGYRVESFTVEPKSVIIEGIMTEIKKVKSVQTEPIDVTGLNETLLQDVKLDLMGKNIRVNLNEIRVKIVIGERVS
jgi:hypothetical protein